MTKHFIDLKNLAQDKVSITGTSPPGEFDFGSESVRLVSPVEWELTAERAGLEIRIQGTLRSTAEIPCSRCLESARHEISKPFDLFFRQRDEHMFDEDDEIELTEKDTRTAFFTGTELAIDEILREQMLLALPMKALCKLDCKGLCPKCGTNLNIRNCNCPKEQFNPHLDALLEIKRRLEDRSS